jgi:acyl carrier protein
VGLDTVELLLSTEELFGISIPDEVAEHIFTVGQLRDFIVEQQTKRGVHNVNGEIVFDQLRTLISHHLAVKPEEVVPHARFIEDLRAD